MNDTTENPEPDESMIEFVFQPTLTSRKNDGTYEHVPLTVEMKGLIEYIVVAIRRTGFDEEYSFDIVIDGEHYYDRVYNDTVNVLLEWDAIIKRFPVNTRIKHKNEEIWAACQSWQR